MIDFNTFRTLYGEAKECADEETYIAERGWQEWMKDFANADQIADFLRDIYNMSRNGFQAILLHFRTLHQMVDLFCMPYSTAQKWKTGVTNPTESVLLLMSYAVINVRRKNGTD